MKGPTERQQEVMYFVSSYINLHNFSPTIREVAAYLKISVKAAHDRMNALKRKSLLQQMSNKKRTVKVVGSEAGADVIEIPILGTVAAGKPIMSEENREGIIKLHCSMLKNNSKYFALKVRGDSMEGAGILDGDTAVIESINTVHNGEVAVVMLDDSVTLKTFYRENSRIRLQPENPRYSPIYRSSDSDLRVLGRLAHVIRSCV